MPVTPSYPGVYIEEVPSAVHTIVGVDTSIAAFIGYTKRGQTNQAVEIFSYGDFERAFGELDQACPVAYAVQQFFNNGGTHAWVVRVAAGALPAQVGMENTPGGTRVLAARASSDGAWGNDMRVEVDYDTAKPDDLFNLTATDYVVQNGDLVPGPTESLRNLSMDSGSPAWAVDTVKNNSALLRIERPAPAVGLMTTAAYSKSALIDTGTTGFDWTTVDPNNNKLMVTIDGDGPYEVSVDLAPVASTSGSAAKLDKLRDQIAQAVSNVTQKTIGKFTDNPSGSAKRIRFTYPATGTAQEGSALSFTNAPDHNLGPVFGLGVPNGGIEASASAAARPAATGTLGTDLDEALLNVTGGLSGLHGTATTPLKFRLSVFYGNASSSALTATLTLLGAAAPASKDALRAQLESVIQAAAADSANAAVADELKGARVHLEGNRLRVVPSGRPDASFRFQNLTPAGTDDTAANIGLTGGVRNVAAYVLSGAAAQAQEQVGPPGNDGTAPGTGDFLGHQLDKTGLYALEDVDLFNLLSIPPTSPPQYDPDALLGDVMTYCEQRRAFFIVDIPGTIDTLPEAQTWIKNLTSKSKNAAAYFPWVMQPDPTRQYQPYPFPPSGMIAGLYARTDAARGVWKAPAGTEATLRGPQSLVYKLTDAENGTLNPLGLNAIRSMPVYGNIVWGGRTLFGADALANEWKYIPVRRIALFIEESLFRGTQWVVFEPNDEPLWAQIRLNVGAFMHSLFRQGAFEGQSPRDAYLVKCDSETTTQNDIDKGIVNILVGFAPLKPAEFVIIQISQLAGQVEA